LSAEYQIPVSEILLGAYDKFNREQAKSIWILDKDAPADHFLIFSAITSYWQTEVLHFLNKLDC
jgi:hypothetical protein